MVSTVAANICDTSLIYSKDFKYLLAEETLKKLLSGKALNQGEEYSEEELINLQNDINRIFQNIVSQAPPQGKETAEVVITAGAPGSGKTVAMVERLKKEASKERKFAYLCPHDVCFRYMQDTYQKELTMGKGTKKELQDAHAKWRPGSEAATHLILANLIRERYDIYFGSTLSSTGTPMLLHFFKLRNYEITVMHVTASDQVRRESIERRDGECVDPKDIEEQGRSLAQRIKDLLEYANRIEFYYRRDSKGEAKLAAIWSKQEPSSRFSGTLQIVDPVDYEKIKQIHNAAIESLGQLSLGWDVAVENPSELVF